MASSTSSYLASRHAVPILGRKRADSATDLQLSSSDSPCIIPQAPTDLNNNLNLERYKTEMCHNFQENGFCKYGTKCQFAHFQHEMRPVTRHHKYKTQMCRTFHNTGFCRYGTRCHFVHSQQEVSSAAKTLPSSTSRVADVASPGFSKQARMQQPTPSSVTDNTSFFDYTNYATSLYVKTDPISNLTAGLTSVVSTGSNIVQDCLSDMYFTPASPVCQSDDTSRRLPVFLSLCD